MKFKKLLASVGIATLAGATLASCAGDSAGGAGNGGQGGQPGGIPQDGTKITVWGPSGQTAVLKKLKTKFLEQNPDFGLDIEIGIMGEPDVGAQVQKDVTKIADVYAFPSDQLEGFIAAGALSALGKKSKEAVTSINSESYLEAATAGDGKLYAYPLTADNGYFMYYDKSVLSESDVDTFEGMFKVLGKKNKKFVMDLGNAWYSAGFFFGAGCSYKVKYNDKQEEESVEINFNNEQGMIAAKAMIDIASRENQTFKPGNDKVLTAGFESKTVAAGISGTWLQSDVMGYLGENYAATKLPKFKVDGKEYQMGSFKGLKLVGVNPYSHAFEGAHKFAAYITSEEAQKIRFEMTEVAPTATNLLDSPALKANIALSALAKQNEFAVNQSSVPANFWDPIAAFSGATFAADKANRVTLQNAQERLDKMVAQIKASKK